MEHFLEGIALSRHRYINPYEKSKKYKYSLLGKLTKTLTEHFLHENVSLRHLLNKETLFLSWRRSAIKEVNDWSHSDMNLKLYYNRPVAIP